MLILESKHSVWKSKKNSFEPEGSHQLEIAPAPVRRVPKHGPERTFSAFLKFLYVEKISARTKWLSQSDDDDGGLCDGVTSIREQTVLS